MKILIVEDDPNISDVVATAFDLGWPDAVIFRADNGAKALAALENDLPDIVILDIGLPDMNGFDVLSQIRLFSEVPIIVLTVRSEESAVIKALSLGADDYVTKPFRQMELLARVKAVTRRNSIRECSRGVSVGDWCLNAGLTELRHGENIIYLTSTEGTMLALLMKNAGAVVTNESLARQIWNRHHPEVADVLRVYIRHLRQKLGDNLQHPSVILNKPRQGYMFVVSAS